MSARTFKFVAQALCCALLLVGWAQVRRPYEIQPTAPTSILYSRQKPVVAIQPISMKLNISAMFDPNRSMSVRRSMAWSIVQRVWTPVRVGSSTVPAWMTWYEEEDLERLFRQTLARPVLSATQADKLANVLTVMNQNRMKDLQASLISARFDKPLHQFQFAEFPALPPHIRPGKGTIYYSPAYVQHLLANASNIANYDDFGFKNVPPKSVALEKSRLGDAPFGGSVFQRPSIRIGGRAAAQPKNLYALSMDSEMPPDAVMIKVNWVPAEGGATRWQWRARTS